MVIWEPDAYRLLWVASPNVCSLEGYMGAAQPFCELLQLELHPAVTARLAMDVKTTPNGAGSYCGSPRRSDKRACSHSRLATQEQL